MFSPLEQFDAIPTYILTLCKYDVTFFNTLIPMILLISCIVFFSKSGNDFVLMPTTIIQTILEINIEFVFNIIKQQIGEDGYIYFPFIFTIFNFILGSNLLSLLPFGIALTSHLIIILWLSLSISLGIFILGIYYHNLKFLKIFIPECPFVLLPMLICTEIFSYIIKSFSLAIRLSANIMAGHTLVYIISSFLLKILNINFYLFILGFIFLILILTLELGVAFLQAHVFTVLICIYFNDAFKGPTHS